MGVPVHERGQIDVHIEGERESLLFEVAIGEELVHLTQLKFDVFWVELDWARAKSYHVTPSGLHMVKKAGGKHDTHRVVDDVVDAAGPSVKLRHFLPLGFSYQLINKLIIKNETAENGKKSSTAYN